MKISIVQTDTLWENKSANFEILEGLINPLTGKSDIVILPEMFNSGFTMNVEKTAEEPDGMTFRWMKRIAENGRFGVCGSYIVKEEQEFYNRFVFVSPENFFHYNKRHLFSMAEENKNFSRGKSRLVFNFRNFRISAYICYDLRFPVWSRNRNDYDLAIYVANWPEARISVWNTLIRGRAIENQCYVAGCNRVGIDGSGIKYPGNSVIVNPRGELLAEAPDEECSITAELSLSVLNDFREKFPVLNDADDFEIKT